MRLKAFDEYRSVDLAFEMLEQFEGGDCNLGLESLLAARNEETTRIAILMVPNGLDEHSFLVTFG